MNTINNFYLYVYLDPRKPGTYQFNELSFNFEPIYLGKGKGNRDMYHHKYYCDNEILNRKLKKIRDLDLEPIIMRIVEHLLEADALLKETEMIKSIGRLNLLEGTLCNLTNGGEGCAGLIQTAEHKQKNSIKNQGTYEERYGVETAQRLKEVRAQQMKGNTYGKNITDKGRKKISNIQSKLWSEKYSEEFIKHRNTCYHIITPNNDEYVVFTNKQLIEFALTVGLPKTSLLMLTWPSAKKDQYNNWTCKIIGTELEFDNKLKNMYTNITIWRK